MSNPQQFFQVPLSPRAQTLRCSLGADTFQLTFRWNGFSSCWILDVEDADGNPVLHGLPCVTGLDMLAQHWAEMPVPGYLVPLTDGDPDAVPTFENLGVAGRILFVTRVGDPFPGAILSPF